MDIKKVEKLLNVSIEGVEEVKGRVFPLFDTAEVQGMKLALIKDPVFVTIDNEIHEKKIAGNFIVIETDGGFLLAKYTGEPNIEVMRYGRGPEDEEAERREEGGEGGEEKRGGGVEEILAKLPKWADGAAVIEKDGSVAVLPVKRSKKEGYYASVSWKPLSVEPDRRLAGRVIMRNKEVIEADVYIGNRYISIRPRRRR